MWIDSSRVKTEVSFNIPLSPALVRLLDSYQYHLPVPSNQKMNAYLKEIAVLCGISKTLTTHLARRTFASLMNEKGLNFTAIQTMSGHSHATTHEKTH